MSIIKEIKGFSAETKVVLFVQWLTSIGYFSVIPFLVVYLVNHQYFSSEFATFQLSLFLIGQYGATFLGGVMTDKLSAQFTMKCGLGLQIACYLLFLLAGNISWFICVLSACIGVSKGLFTPAAKAFVAKLAAGGNKVLLFSFRSTVNNVGVAVGSAIGGLFLGVGSDNFFLAAASSQLLAFLLLLKINPTKQNNLSDTEANIQTVKIKDALTHVFRKPVFWFLSALYALFSLLYMQLESAFPLFASAEWGDLAVSVLFITNAVVVIVLQVFLNVWMNKRLSHWLTMAVGFFAFTMCFLGIQYVTDLWVFVLLIALYTIGEITIDPTIDAVASESVSDRYLGISYSILGIAGLFGGVAGNSIAGHFLNAVTGSPQTLWVVCVATAITSILVIMAFLFFMKRKRHLFKADVSLN